MLTIMVPAGLGVREATLTTLLAGQLPTRVAAALAFRLYLIVLDLILVAAASLLTRPVADATD